MSKNIPFDQNNKFVSLGGVFSTHTEDGRPKKWPDLWLVPDEAIVQDGDEIILPPEVENVYIGPEITAVVGDEMWRVSEENVADAIAGFTVSTDVTVKGEWPGYANENTPHITGTGYKIFPTFRPALSTYEPLDTNEITNLRTKSFVDGTIDIDSSTKGMGFDLLEIFTHISKIIKLQPGDLVALGDPGNAQLPIDNASEIRSEVELLGTLTNPVEHL